MSEQADNFSKIRQWLLLAGDNQLPPEEFARFEQLLRDDPAARRFYLEESDLYGTIRWDNVKALAEPPVSSAMAAVGSSRGIGRFFHSVHRYSQQHAIAATLLIATALYGSFGLIVWQMSRYQTPKRDDLAQGLGSSGFQDAAQSVAQITALHDALTMSADTTLHIGQQLYAGEMLEIASGSIELLFADGAQLHQQGPAKLRIEGANAGFLHSGRILAEVPHAAIGFSIETPALTVVDLGTEFGVEVDPQGHSQVHVFRGAVETHVQQIGAAPMVTRLAAGEGVSIEVDGGAMVKVSADAKRFGRDARVGTSDSAKFKLLGFYPFDGDACDMSGKTHDAAKVSNVEFVAGHEGQAAFFKGYSASFIDLPIDASADTVPDLTWGAWVKPSKEVTAASEILSTDNGGYDRILTIDSRRGTVGENQHCFAAMAGAQVGVLLSQGPRPTPERWTFVAAAYRSDSKAVVLYVENRALAGGKGGLVSDIAGDVVIGPSYRTIRVGCHPDGSESFAGAIDNVFIVRGALGHRDLEAIRTGGSAQLLKLRSAE